jgi:hypothetical protein
VLPAQSQVGSPPSQVHFFSTVGRFLFSGSFLERHKEKPLVLLERVSAFPTSSRFIRPASRLPAQHDLHECGTCLESYVRVRRRNYNQVFPTSVARVVTRLAVSLGLNVELFLSFWYGMSHMEAMRLERLGERRRRKY